MYIFLYAGQTEMDRPADREPGILICIRSGAADTVSIDEYICVMALYKQDREDQGVKKRYGKKMQITYADRGFFKSFDTCRTEVS